MPHRLHQVGLAEARAAVDEQRVVGFAGIFGDLHGCSLGKMIALALDEALERGFRIQLRADLLWNLRSRSLAKALRWLRDDAGRRDYCIAARTDLDHECELFALPIAQHRGDALGGVVLHPIHGESIRRQAVATRLLHARPATVATRCSPAARGFRSPGASGSDSRVRTCGWRVGGSGVIGREGESTRLDG